MTRITFFHTVATLSSEFEELANKYFDDVEWCHAVDESVLDDMLEMGKLTPGVTERICTQLSLAQRGGADIILDTCSSTSPAVDIAREIIDIPIIKIDDPMAERAVDLGDRIAVVATAASTLNPSRKLVEAKSRETDRDTTVETVLVDDALEARRMGRLETHDELVSEAVERIAGDFEVIILAQASMSHLESIVSERVTTPVLSSPDLAMERVAEFVDAGS
jgi:Asp/Glu/hydantoin racemase